MYIVYLYLRRFKVTEELINIIIITRDNHEKPLEEMHMKDHIDVSNTNNQERTAPVYIFQSLSLD